LLLAGAAGRQVVFFESDVADFRVLEQGLAANTDAVILDAGGDGLAQMAAYLDGHTGLAAIHIVSHGAPGALELGTVALDEQALKTDAADMQTLAAALAPGGDLVLWGCDVAAGPAGEAFIRDLADRTGANVAASAHLVGAADLGGSWQLQETAGSVHTADPFSAAARASFDHVLQWIPVASMSSGRYEQTATLLNNGEVLVAGGIGSNGLPQASAELFDPASDTWSYAGSMSTARMLHTATLLPNGMVLVAGGYTNGFHPVASAELYDPSSNAWYSAGSLSDARVGAVATLLPDGQALITGGLNNSGNLASAELYDPGSNTWYPAAPMNTPRYYPSATLLADGTVLVAGGFNGDAYVGDLTSAEVYDSGSNTWSPVGDMSTGREVHTATLLTDGTVLVTGGALDDVVISGTELYDPSSASWSVRGDLSTPREGQTAILLTDGRVLVAGGFDGVYIQASADMYDPGSGTWYAAESMGAARFYHTATLLPDGTVLVTGGYGGGSLSSAELYVPDDLPAPHHGNVHVTAGSSQAALPADALPTGGAGTFTVTLFPAADTGLRPASTPSSATVAPATANQFLRTIPAGEATIPPLDVSIAAYDPNGDIDVNGGGTLPFGLPG
jgi:hypothetical protein